MKSTAETHENTEKSLSVQGSVGGEKICDGYPPKIKSRGIDVLMPEVLFLY